jgi:hypothetical protein
LYAERSVWGWELQLRRDVFFVFERLRVLWWRADQYAAAGANSDAGWWGTAAEQLFDL